jgi:hypothetical protein
MPVLSIILPTYNRSGHLKKLVGFLTANLIDDARYDMEIIVVDNASTDGTANFLAEGIDHRIRVVSRIKHLPTAEENIFQSLAEATGEYVWFLGDDDVPVLSNFDRHYRRLAQGRHDLLVFNPAIVDSSGTLAVLQNVKINREELELPVGDLVETIGCFFTLAGISNCIVRRACLSAERGLQFFRAAPIYSMVAWLIDAAHGRPTVFVNQPLVYYRENDYSDGHWSRVATRMGVGDLHFWTSGILALLEALVAAKCITPAQIGRIMEVDRDGMRYSLIDDMLFKYQQQIVIGGSDADPRQRMASDDLERVARFFAVVDPTTYDLLLCLQALATKSDKKAMSHEQERFLKLFGARQAVGPWARRVSFVHNGYEIIKTPVQWTAIRAGVPGRRNEVMRYVDPLPRKPQVLVSSSWDELREQIGELTTSNTSDAQSDADGVALATATMELGRARDQIRALHASTSWKITAPLRGLKRGLSRK